MHPNTWNFEPTCVLTIYAYKTRLLFVPRLSPPTKCLGTRLSYSLITCIMSALVSSGNETIHVIILVLKPPRHLKKKLGRACMRTRLIPHPTNSRLEGNSYLK